METDMTDMPLDELKQATLAKVQEMVQDQSGNPISPRLMPNEEESAAERCSEKLVDLVVLLTTKLDNNVEDLRKELTDNINENIERFEKVQQQQEEEYGKLCLQLQLCNEENERLNKMLENLTKDHNQTLQKHENLLERFELLKSNHENVVKSHQTLFEKHNNEIQKSENIQNNNLDKQIKDFEETKTSIKDTSNHIMNHISETSTSIHDLIKLKENEALKRHKKSCEEINEINDKLNDHETRHKKEDDAIKKNRNSIDSLSEHIEAEFKQMKEKQCNNEQVHQRLKEQLAHFQKTSDETHDNIRQNIKDIENELEKNRREHDQFNQEINNNKAQISKNNDLTNNEIDSINENHAKLKQAHEKLKSEVESQNKYNADNQDSVDKALKKLNEEKNAINCDIDMIRNDIRTNENSRRNQDSVFTNKLDTLKQKQMEHGETLLRLESGIKVNEEKIKSNYGIFEEEVKRLDDKNQQFSNDVKEKHEFIKELISDTKTNLQKEIKDSCATVKEYCRSNTEDVNNNIIEFKEAVHVANVELDNKIVGCGKDLERCRADFQANLEKSFNELDEVVQNLATGEIADSVREIASFRTKIKDIGSKVFEMDAEVEEMTRDRRNNILIHGLPVQDGECMESLANIMADMVRTRLGIRREIMLVNLFRLTPTKSEVGGWPPLVVSFQHYYDKEAILNRADMLERTGILITEDMSRTVREQWGELHKFMSRVKAKYPTSQCFLKQEKLYVDNRMFVWNLEEGRVTEQMVVTIPATPGNIFPGLNVQNRCPAKLKLEDLQHGFDPNK